MATQEKKKNITRKKLQEMRENFTEINGIAEYKKHTHLQSMLHSMFFKDVERIQSHCMKSVQAETILDRYHEYKTIELAIDELQPLVIN